MVTNGEVAMDIMPEVKAAARAVARDWSGVIDSDDLEQEIWTRVLGSSPNYLGEVYQLSVEKRVSLLRQIGHQIGLEYRNDYELFSGNVRYGLDEVRDLLKAGALTRLKLYDWTMADYATDSPDKETFTSLVDLGLGMVALEERNTLHANRLTRLYYFGDRPDEHHEYMRRAEEVLTDLMNGTHRRRYSEYEDGPGTRRVTSNRAAQVGSAIGYAGE